MFWRDMFCVAFLTTIKFEKKFRICLVARPPFVTTTCPVTHAREQTAVGVKMRKDVDCWRLVVRVARKIVQFSEWFRAVEGWRMQLKVANSDKKVPKRNQYSCCCWLVPQNDSSLLLSLALCQPNAPLIKLEQSESDFSSRKTCAGGRTLGLYSRNCLRHAIFSFFAKTAAAPPPLASFYLHY